MKEVKRVPLVLCCLFWWLSSVALAQTPAPTQCVSTASAGGTGDVITLPLLPCSVTTTLLVLTFTATNATTTPTIQMIGGTAQVAIHSDGTPLAVGEFAPGVTALMSNNGTNWLRLSSTTFAGSAQIFSAVTIPSFTQGSLVFAGSGGLLSQDNANAFWDATNHRLGLGTTTPQVTLDVPDNASVGASPVLVGAKGLNALTNWLEASVPFTSRQAEIVGLSTVGGYGAIGGTRIGDNPLSVGGQGFGIGGFGVSNGLASGQVTFGVFGYTIAAGTGIAQGSEFDIINLGGPNPQVTPYSIPVPLTISGWFASGDPSYVAVAFTGSISGTTLTVSAVSSGSFHTYDNISGGGTLANTFITACLTGTCVGQDPSLWKTGTYSVNRSQTVGSQALTVTPLDASVGIGIVNNTTKFKTGLFFQKTALTGCSGVDGENVVCDAISLGRLHGLHWWNSGDTTTPAASIYSVLTSAVPHGSNIRFDDTGIVAESNNGFASLGTFWGIRLRPVTGGTCMLDLVAGVGTPTGVGTLNFIPSPGGATNCNAVYGAQGTGTHQFFNGVGGTGTLIGTVNQNGFNAANFIASAVASVVGAGQIAYGATTAAKANCGNLAASIACVVLNIAGTVQYVPYY